MADPPDTGVAAVLRAAQAGDREAAARLPPLAYAELRRLAQARMAPLPPGQALQPTALVHEAYPRLVGQTDRPPEGLRHFFAAARAMRDILVDTSRTAAGPVGPGPYDILLHESGRYPIG
jgi:hypothetical protein